MLYTKLIQANKESYDGIRISIMRKPRGEYDLLISAVLALTFLNQDFV